MENENELYQKYTEHVCVSCCVEHTNTPALESLFHKGSTHNLGKSQIYKRIYLPSKGLVSDELDIGGSYPVQTITKGHNFIDP